MANSVTNLDDSQQLIELAPDLRQRRYNEIADRVSMPASHLIWFLLEVEESGRVSWDKLRTAIREAGHGWTKEQLDSYLKELRKSGCLEGR